VDYPAIIAAIHRGDRTAAIIAAHGGTAALIREIARAEGIALPRGATPGHGRPKGAKNRRKKES